jgi:hypothetical protein
MDQRASLIQLARVCIDFDRSVNWSLRLYSREKSSMNEVSSFIYRIKEYIYIFLFFRLFIELFHQQERQLLTIVCY